MSVSWGGICSSNPPSVAISVREATYTYGNLVHSQAFTVNIPSVSHVKQADLAGSCSGRDTDKFGAAGLTPVRSELVHAPYIKEFPLVIECNVIHIFDLGLHKQFVGQIRDVKAEEGILGPNGHIDVAKLQPFTFAPDDGGYYRVEGFIGQAFSIGKP
jgi:flavin reductase (DIM6/NTAB) family NADH-FMN oxidoreductase RutF